jgi:ATP-dependent Clp protease protease subunit
MNKLLALYRANRGKGEGFRALDGEEPRMMIYDVIVSSDADAEWLGGASAESFVRALQGMSAPRVHVHINSPGGDAFAGIAMANAIRAYQGEIVVHVDGIAASAAGFLVAATPHAVMAPGSMVMVHKSWTIALGNSDDLMATAAVLEKLDGQQAELFRAKVADYDWESALAAETWFTAAEAIAIGLASEQEADKPVMALAFDLSAFDSPPKLPTAQAEPEPQPDNSHEIETRRRKVRALELATNP